MSKSNRRIPSDRPGHTTGIETPTNFRKNKKKMKRGMIHGSGMLAGRLLEAVGIVRFVHDTEL